MNELKKVKMGKLIRGIVVFPVIFGVLLLGAAVALLILNAGDIPVCIVFGVFIAYAIASLIFYLLNTKHLKQRLISFVKEYGNIEGELIADFPLAYCVTDMGGAIIISNDKFSKFYDDSAKEVSIFDIFGFSPNDYIFEDDFRDISVQYNQRSYRIRLQRLNMPEEMLSDAVAVLPRKDMQVMTVYLFDETEVVNMVKAGVEQQLVAGTIYVDNFEETLQQTPYVDRSMVMAKIDQIIEEYFTAVNGIVRKVEKDKYFVIFKRKHMPAMQRTKFDILDSIKAIKTGSEMPITISVGVGVGGDYPGNFEQARQALDLALGRGGDQVVVKEGERIYFYGGKTKQSEKNTRVKARVTAQQLKEIIQSKERVVVMGHKVSDIDSFGASVGIYKAAKALGKKAHIVINELTNTVQPVLETFLDDPAYAEGVFLSVEDSYGYVNDDTLLVVVDVNKPDYFEVPTLIYQTKSIVLVDHHLQTGERIDHLVLSYVEPTASSASEMVTEILQYITSDLKLAKNEAEALYAGILIDTNYFAKNTGVRTFEAAAFLKRNGVDVARVKGMFSDKLEDVKIKAEALRTAESLGHGFVLAVCPTATETPTVAAAQVANELLEVQGVTGSFVLLDYNEKIFISARSKGDVNVQLIMERMGGGGHLNTAGAQMYQSTIEDTKKKLILTINKMIEEGLI